MEPYGPPQRSQTNHSPEEPDESPNPIVVFLKTIGVGLTLIAFVVLVIAGLVWLKNAAQDYASPPAPGASRPAPAKAP